MEYIKQRQIKFSLSSNNPLENLFGCIRNHGMRNINPNCTTFKASLKSFTINNFFNKHSPGSNCEEDDSEGALSTLRQFLLHGRSVYETIRPTVQIQPPDAVSPLDIESTSASVKGTHGYIAGYIGKRVLTKLKKCSICLSELQYTGSGLPLEHNIINIRSYSANALCKPTTMYYKVFKSIIDIVSCNIPNVCYMPNIKAILCKYVMDNVQFHFTCKIHDVKNILTDYILTFYINTDPLKKAAYININDQEISLRPEVVDTAKVCEFLDSLFDSVNGSAIFNTRGKELHCAVHSNSPHIEFWSHAIKILETMKFQTPNTPSLKNFIFTLKNMKRIYEILMKTGAKYMMPRTFNQDPLENFFGQIRQRGIRYTNPSCGAFTPFYKSLLVNNLTSPHSIGSNCENDKSAILMTLQQFLTQVTITKLYIRESWVMVRGG
ncbi:hat family dimerization domaincontaining protein-related [Holotrichia oblita]|uniref:Hat family dimerization domaincontaining protein-related n=1 Tax=Holotrichia oblita TaxID=644536 RepID=A0ACB9SI91_HOLOL|nr:hat family dimerization domaincontaining protein-related [Holotrichia oblita]